MYVDVAVPLPLYQTFSYSVPDARMDLRPGCRVVVPFARRQLIGIVVRASFGPPSRELKPVRLGLDQEPLLSPSLIRLGLWMSAYYLAPVGEALRVMLPPRLLSRKISTNGPFTERFWPTRTQQAITQILKVDATLTQRQKKVLEQLQNRNLPVPLRTFLREARCSRSLIENLTQKGIIHLEAVEVDRSPWSQIQPAPIERHELNPDQQRILSRIEQHLEKGTFASMLIHGVTGSGKTEIYLNAIAQAAAKGKSALVLVPEIGLTPQIARQFRGWFGQEVAILHSALSDGERFDQWRRIRSAQARVIVGTRSAVFAPVENLGIMIVDEEHDGSYKQEDLPRYHARDVALKRAEIEGALVLLGSATPQLETYYRARSRGRPEYQLLASRILDRPLPQVDIIDMRAEFDKRGRAEVVSEPLRDAIQDRLARREQVLILLNRRGYASALLCRSCGNTERCDNCSISLTYHQRTNRLQCHYCGALRPVPKRCAACEKEYIFFLGYGTEKIQEKLKQLFPQAVVDRLDRDTAQRKGSFETILGNLAAGRTDILVGTQMIAKGHDFPGVTLVGVISAEQSLRIADFHAAERTFQLLTQVAGRAGRGERPGEVIIQTYYPNHYSLKSACSQDYHRFFKEEIRFRKNFQYPPFSALANLLLHGPQEKRTWNLARRIVDLLSHHRDRLGGQNRMRILGPAVAALEKIKGEYRVQILIKATDRGKLHRVLEATLEDVREKKVSLKQLSVDIDPISLL